MAENPREKVLFICTHNSARSQMAEGIFRYFYGEKYEVYSAGSEPQGIHPLSVKVMHEIGIDISNHESKGLNEFKELKIDYVVTVCQKASKSCPFFPGASKYFNPYFEDPCGFQGKEEEQMEYFRIIRDEIKNWIEKSFINNIRNKEDNPGA
jgi:arsenate reductase